jgi:putative FmdB family regulatory protein
MTYEYKCNECNKITSIVISYKEKDQLNIICPKCKGHMHYVFQATPVHFKGKGWTK